MTSLGTNIALARSGVTDVVNPNVQRVDAFDDGTDDLSELPHAACYTCNNRNIARLYGRFRRLVSEGVPPNVAMDRLGFHRYCCRQLLMNPIRLPIGVNVDVDYRKLGLTLNPETVSLRTGKSGGFLITQPPRQRRTGLAQAIGPSVPVVGSDQPLPPLSSRPTNTFGVLSVMPMVGGQQSANQPPSIGQQAPTLSALSGSGFQRLGTGQPLGTSQQPLGTSQQPLGMVAQRLPEMVPRPASNSIITPTGTSNQGVNLLTQGLGSLALQTRPTPTDLSNSFPMIESVPSVSRQTNGNVSQYPFRM